MEEQITLLIESKNKLFLKNKKYILDNDWSSKIIDSPSKTKKKDNDEYKILKSCIDYKKKEFQIQNEVITGMLQHITRFLKKIKSFDVIEETQKFLDESLEIIELHTDRVDFYIDNIDISEIDNMDIRSDELQFHNSISREVELIQDRIGALGLRNSKLSDTSGIAFLNDVRAPLSMCDILCNLYPEIKKKVEEKEIDFETPPNNEMLLYMDNVPEWDTKLHFFEQKKEILQFYVDEFKKLKNGILIDGVYISGWAYYHINIFEANIPKKVWNDIRKKYINKDNIVHPPLRDSDYILFENRYLQEQGEYKFMFVGGSRRIAKTTGEASMLGHAATIGMGTLLCASSSDKDLGQIAKAFKTDSINKNPAFRVINVTNDWTKKIEMGIKRKDGQTIPSSTLYTINTDGGNNKEIFAGFTPDLVVYDESMKDKFLETLEGLLPAMVGEEGTLRCYGILTGTGGDEALSADGFKCLNDPETYEILPMQWNVLERGVAEEFKTWREEKLKPFGTFMPGQFRVDMPKIESNLADYLGRPESKELRKIKIKVTDWEKANNIITEKRASVFKDKVKHNKEVIYCPLKPSEIFMSGKLNRFPVIEAKLQKEYLLETGLWDRRRELIRDPITQKISAVSSKKELAPFPHKGGIIDAPFLIFEELPTEKPIFGTYAGSFDDYAVEDSESSSVSTFYVAKNEIIGDPFSNKIVASLSFRPEKHIEVWEKWLMLMEVYNLRETTFGENVNYGIKDFLDRKKLTDTYLAPSLNFSQLFTIPNNQKRLTGWSPTTTKKFLLNYFIDYCNESFDIEQEDGSIKIYKGVQLIEDIGLLEEIIQWNENLNVDRITSAMACLAYTHYLRTSNTWRSIRYKQKIEYRESQKENKPKQLNFFRQLAIKQRSFFRQR